MATVTALTDKVKFVNEGKVQYKVETLLGGKRSGWKQHFDTQEKAMEFIQKEQSDRRVYDPTDRMKAQFLVTEVTTKTLGVF